MSRDEFIARWERLPGLKRAELLEGEVFLPSPVGRTHGVLTSIAVYWLGDYAAHTPACDGGTNGTWLMGEDVPQPDADLRVLPEFGGQSSETGPYAAGAPELILEVAVSTASTDRRRKRKIYERAGVAEYVIVLPEDGKVLWLRRVGETFQEIQPDVDGLFRSTVFPGLWLDPAALLERRRADVHAALGRGIASDEHQRFVKTLMRRATGSLRDSH